MCLILTKSKSQLWLWSVLQPSAERAQIRERGGYIIECIGPVRCVAIVGCNIELPKSVTMSDERVRTPPQLALRLMIRACFTPTITSAQPCLYQTNLICGIEGGYVADVGKRLNSGSRAALPHLAGGLGGKDI